MRALLTYKKLDTLIKLQVLAIGGGGAGGGICATGNGAAGGGGGAGQFFCGECAIPKGEYPITIGCGGVAYSYGVSCDGGKTTGLGLDLAGGGHGQYVYPNCCLTSPAGASYGGGGGGGAATFVAACCGASAMGGGTSGGNGKFCRISSGGMSGGGGGGAGGNGYTPSSWINGGTGGQARYSSITGQQKIYGAGGGGGGHGPANCCPVGGYSEGGGCGGCYRNYDSSAGKNAVCYGSGGGGAAYNGSRTGGCGMQGVFIISYPSSCGYNISGGNCIYECNGNCIHIFTSNGCLTVN